MYQQVGHEIENNTSCCDSFAACCVCVCVLRDTHRCPLLLDAVKPVHPPSNSALHGPVPRPRPEGSYREGHSAKLRRGERRLREAASSSTDLLYDNIPPVQTCVKHLAASASQSTISRKGFSTTQGAGVPRCDECLSDFRQQSMFVPGAHM